MFHKRIIKKKKINNTLNKSPKIYRKGIRKCAELSPFAEAVNSRLK